MEGQQPELKPVCGLRRLRDVQVGHEGGGEEVCLLCYREGGCGKLHRAGGVHNSGENRFHPPLAKAGKRKLNAKGQRSRSK